MHQQTLQLGVPSVVMMILLIIGVISLVRNDGGPVLAIVAPFVILAFLACVIGLLVAVRSELNLRDRDAAIREQLRTADIVFVRLGRDDNHVVVEAQGCQAEFQIKDEANAGAWPLVSGTGRAIAGCGGEDLDQLFALEP